MIKPGETILGIKHINTREGFRALAVRWQNGTRVISYEPLPFWHYGFVRTDKLSHIDTSEISKIEITEARNDYGKKLKTINGDEVSKISVKQPDELKQIFMNNKHVQFYECDVPYGKKVLNDFKLETMPEDYMPAYCDIETDPRGATNVNMQAAKQKILSAAINDRFFCEDNEQLIMKQVDDVLKNYNAFVSWSDFDINYLRQRARNYEIRTSYTSTIGNFDCMYFFAQLIMKKTSNAYFKLVSAVDYTKKLNAKIDPMPDLGVKENYGKVYEFFENDREKLRLYNSGDVKAMQQIDESLQLTKGMFELCRFLRLWPEDFRQHSRIDDMLKLRIARERGIVLPNRPSEKIALDSSTSEAKSGAFVFSPVAGFHEHVVVLDFASLYPSIMTSLNLGPDSICDCDRARYRAPNGVCYDDKDCINTTYLKSIQEYFEIYDSKLKKAKPDTLEYAVAFATRLKMKLIKNATFGVNGYRTARLYNKNVFESVTSVGQSLIKFASKYMNDELGIPTIYGDTDSIMLKLPGQLDITKFAKSITKLNAAIKNYSKREFGGEINTEIELDYYADKAYFTSAKKRYIMHVAMQDWPPKECSYTKVTGFETVRRDSTALLREVQKTLFNKLLTGVPVKKLEQELLPYFTKIKEDLFAGKLDEKIVFTKSIRADLENYAVSLPHTRAAKILQDAGKYSAGADIDYIVISDEIERVVVNGKKTRKRVITTWPVLAGPKKIQHSGYEYVWQTQILNVLERFGMYGEDKELGVSPKQKTMTAYFMMLGS